jgi:hypothetical protein
VNQEDQVQDANQATDVAVPEEHSAVASVDTLSEFGITIPASGPVAVANRTLDIAGTVSFALDVARIDRAESFYHDLFELDIVCRAWRLDDGSWDVTTETIDWPADLINGYYPELVVLQRPGWTFVLHGIGRGQVLTSPKLGDATVPVSPETLRKLRARILIKSYTVVRDEPEEFAFRDPYAVVWTLVPDPTLSAAK